MPSHPVQPPDPEHPDVLGCVPRERDPLSDPSLVGDDSGMRAILQSIAGSPDQDCLPTMVEHLARALGVRFAAVTEFDPTAGLVRPLGFWDGGSQTQRGQHPGAGRHVSVSPWALAGTPCERVLAGEFIVHSSGLQALFPLDELLAEVGAQSYAGVPLIDIRGFVLGHLFVMDDRPLNAPARDLALLRVFAALASSELSRRRLEASLGKANEDLRDLFDEAPIAYVHEGLDSRFIRANKTALRVLGISRDEVQGTYGRDFIPNTQDAQARLKQAFESVGKGIDTSGVVLELRQKHTGKPIWIQWWSRPDGSGTFTRTMFLDITDRILIEQEQARLQAQNRYLHEEFRSSHHFGEIVGRSAPLLRTLERVTRVAPTDTTVLIQGETGTGKELVARALHDQSPRRHNPFIKVNCAALPAGLVESEFFGHEKGAFTGASSARRGRFELADGGTIFLDEVGEVSPDVQVKLLRVLQECEFERVGGAQTIRVNVRVIAATNRDLAHEVEGKRFRADLYYRLSVFPIQMPALRERTDDLPLLVTFFVSQLASSLGKRVEGIDSDTMKRLCRYTWPGNIRELRNVLERAVILSNSPVLSIDQSELADPRPDSQSREHVWLTLQDVEKDHILSVLKRTHGAIGGPQGAAKILGLPASTLRSRMERLGIKT